MPATTPTQRTTRKRGTATAPQARAARPAPARMTLDEAMAALEKAGSAQTRKTYLRHGATEPLFGVSFATLATLVKRIKVDHDLACALWDTGNFDARNLAVKIADPARMTAARLDRWAKDPSARMCGGYVSMLAGEGPHAAAKAAKWPGSSDPTVAAAGWQLVAHLAMRDETVPEPWFRERLAAVETTIHSAPNTQREAMNQALISIGCRAAALRKAALAAAKRIGKVHVDHGDTACKTPDAAQYIEKCWAHAAAKGFESPAAQERARPSPRVRC